MGLSLFPVKLAVSLTQSAPFHLTAQVPFIIAKETTAMVLFKLSDLSSLLVLWVLEEICCWVASIPVTNR